MFTMSEYLYMLFYFSLKCIYSFHIKYLVSVKLSNIYTALWMSTYCKTVYMSHFDNGCRTSFCYFYSVFSISFVHVELQIIWRNQVFIFYINILAEFLGFIAVKWTLNGSCLSRWLYKFTVDFLFLPFLLSVVPLFLGLGISLCDNHFYYFHFPHPLFKLSFFPHHSLSSTWHFKKKHWHICLFIFLLYTHFFNVLWLCSHTVVFSITSRMINGIPYFVIWLITRNYLVHFLYQLNDVMLLVFFSFVCIFIALRQFPWKRKTFYPPPSPFQRLSLCAFLWFLYIELFTKFLVLVCISKLGIALMGGWCGFLSCATFWKVPLTFHEGLLQSLPYKSTCFCKL